jgi:hypothetical protein
MSPSISATLKQDHIQIQAIYQRIVASDVRDEQIRWQNLFVWEVARNTVGEELVLYPALEKHVQGGDRLAKKGRQENQQVSLASIPIPRVSGTKC